MGIPVLVLGESGSGKSTSLRNFEPGEVLVFNVVNNCVFCLGIARKTKVYIVVIKSSGNNCLIAHTGSGCASALGN